MAYNKARAEKEWLKWKNEEEAKLRELGVDEDTIQRLHTYDWAVFNSDRRFYEPQGEWTSRTDWDNAQWMELPVRDSASLLESLENQRLFQKLSKEDQRTLDIIFLRCQGWSYKEIAQKLHMSLSFVKKRISRLRRKF